jgi:CHAT domain-containing protein
MNMPLRRAYAPLSVAVGMTIAMLTLRCQRERADDRTDLLREYAATARRPVALRLAGFPFSPRKLQRGGGDEGTRSPATKSIAYAIVASPLGGSGDLEAQRTQADAELVVGNISAAVARLRSALERAPTSAALWIDYSAALFEQAGNENSARTLAEALAAADHALRLAPHSAEARFNRASVLQRLSLNAAAHRAWKHHLEIEKDRSWAAESQRNLQQSGGATILDEWKKQKAVVEEAAMSGRSNDLDRLVAAFPQHVRRWAETECLMRWAQHWTRGERNDADRVLDMTARIADRLIAFRGEGLLSSTVAVMQHAAAKDSRAADELAQGHLAYDSARRLIAARKPSEALPLLRDAERRFAKLGSPMALVARTYRAGVLFDSRDAREARALLDSALQEASPEFHALRGEVLWEHARIAARLGDIYRALDYATRAAASFTFLGEGDNAARNRIEAASILSALGRPEEAWKIRQQVFADASRSGAPSVLATAVHEAASDELVDGRLDIARSFFDVFLEEASPSPLLRFNGQLWRVFIGTRLDEKLDPRASLADLTSTAARIQDTALREDAFDQLRFADALISTDRDRSLRLLTDSIDFRERAGRLARAAEAYAERGRLHREGGDAEKAMNDFERVLAVLEKQRESVSDDELRDSFFSAAENACDHLIELRALAGDTEKTFEAAERCRARRILDTVSGSSIGLPLPLREVQRRLRRDVAVILYASLPRRLVTIVVTSSMTNMHMAPVPRAELDTIGSAFRQAVAGDEPRLHGLARDLHSILIAPIGGLLGNARLAVVGDTTIMNIPFAALEDSSNSLVREHEIVFAPSASAYVARSPRRRTILQKALLIGDPAFDTGIAHSLERLPGAASEVRALAAGYPNAIVLTAATATPAAMLREASDSDVIHIAAHAVVNARSAAQSALLLAATNDDDGVVQLPEIAHLDLRQQPLVILAGCRTGSFGGGKGSVRSIAFAFLAAGSPSVVASLWDVDDETTRVFSERLHAQIRRGVPPEAALRAAQIELMNGTNPVRRPSTWAAFQLFGID